VSAARHAQGRPAPAADEVRATRSPAVPLLIMVLGLAIATIWFVALPMLDEPVHAKRTCEVIVLESGSTRCVTNPKTGTKAVHQKPRPAKRTEK
jgi:hypothetical protein